MDPAPPDLEAQRDQALLRRSLAWRGSYALVLQVVLRLRGFLLIPILTRALAPAEVGVVSLANALTSGLAPLLLMGVHTGLSLHLVRLHGRVVRPAILTVLVFSAVFSTTTMTVFLVMVSVGVFGAALSPLLPVLMPVGVFAIGLTLREIGVALPQVRQKLSFIGWNSVLMDFGGVLVAIWLVLAGQGAYGALLGIGGMGLMGALISCAYSLRTAEGDWTFDPAFLRTTLKTALPVAPLAVGLWTLQSSDYFFVSYYRGPSGVAIYGLAYSLASITLLALAAANLTYLPTCVEILRKGRAPFALFIDDSTRFFLVGGVAAIAFAVAAGPQLAGWLAGAAYVDSGRLLPVVVGAYVCFSLGQMQQFVPAAMTQDMKGSARAHGWAALANVLANFILVPRFGLWGAAWSTVTAYALALFLLTRSVHSLLPELGWPRKLGAMAVLLVMATSLALLVRPQATGPASALLWGALTIVVTVGLAASLKLIARQDMKLLAKLRPSTF